jgi:hypothetical protein
VASTNVWVLGSSSASNNNKGISPIIIAFIAVGGVMAILVLFLGARHFQKANFPHNHSTQQMEGPWQIAHADVIMEPPPPTAPTSLK